jgi:PAS domain S-box-containing protein
MTEQPGYETAFRAAPQALIVADAAGVIRLVSTEAERLLRRSAAELVGQRLDRIFVRDPTEPLRSGVSAPTPAGGPPGVLATSAMRLPDGQQVPVDLRISGPAVTRPGPGGPVVTGAGPGPEAAGAVPGEEGWVVVAVDDQGEPSRSRAAIEYRLRRLADAEREHERLLADLIRTQERERARIAAGVHDDTLQVITAAMLRLQQLRRRLRDPDALEVLGRLEESIALAADRLRRLIFDFRPPALERKGLPAAVRDALSRMHDDTGIGVRLDNRLTAEPPLPARVLLYRIIQEALANVGKHAAASMVEVTLTHQDGGYLARVADNGVGIADGDHRLESPEPGHLGLVLMRERAEFAGGWFRLESTPGSGSAISAWIPRGADLETTLRPPALRGGGVLCNGADTR